MAPTPTSSPVRGGPRLRDSGVARLGRWLCPTYAILGLWLGAWAPACLAPAENFVASGPVGSASGTELGRETSEGTDVGASGTGGGGREASSGSAGSDESTGDELASEATQESSDSTELETTTDETGLGDEAEWSTTDATTTGTTTLDAGTEEATTGSATDTEDSSSEASSETIEGTQSEEASSSGEETAEADTAEDSSDTGTMGCRRQMCAGFNIAAAADDSLTAIGHFIGYPVQLGPDVEQILGIEVFTGEVVGDNAFSVWTDLASQPFLELQRVPWRSGLANGWQGSDFPTPVDVVPGSVVWVVWHSLAGVQANVALGGTVTLAKVSTNRGATWVNTETPRAAMLKVYCCVEGGVP